MSTYTKSTNFAAKDSLASGNPAKIVKGTEIDTEFSNIETAVNSKADSADLTAKANLASPALTGTPTAPTPSATNDSTQIATTEWVRDANLTNGTQVTASGTSVDFTSIPNWVKRITVQLNGVSTNGTDAYLLQLGDSGGAETSGYVGVGGNQPNGGSNANTSYTAGFGIPSAVATNAFYGVIVLTLMNAATNTWTAHGVLSNPGGPAMVLVSGTKSLTGTLDRVRLTTTGGVNTFDNGSVNITYE